MNLYISEVHGGRMNLYIPKYFENGGGGGEANYTHLSSFFISFFFVFNFLLLFLNFFSLKVIKGCFLFLFSAALDNDKKTNINSVHIKRIFHVDLHRPWPKWTAFHDKKILQKIQ